MSLALRIVSAVVLLGVALAIQLAGDCLGSWRTVRQARTATQAEQAASVLLDATVALANERGVTNGILANPVASSQATDVMIVAERDKGLAALRTGMDLAAALPSLDPHAREDAIAAIGTATAAMASLRAAVDGAIHGSARPPTPAEWYPAASRQIDAVSRLRRMIDGIVNEETDFSRLVAVRDALFDMAEYTGRERGGLNGIIAADARLTPSAVTDFGVLRGRVSAAWARIEPRIARLPLTAQAPVRAVGQAVFDTFASQSAPVFDAAERGAAWPVSAQAWFAMATTALHAIQAGQDAAGQALGEVMVQRADRGWRGLLVATSWLAGGLIVCGATIWYVLFRVVRPLDRAIASLHALTEGDLDRPLPAARGTDEVARLLRATLTFRDALLARRRLEARQGAMAREAEVGRVQAVRDIGTLIEHESGRAVLEVVGLAGQLTEVATGVSGDANAIADAARVSADAAMDGQRQSDAAATAARGLSEAIHEVARQMTIAASNTRGVVGRAIETRESFEGLFASVVEVQEVARLIGDIASRTNLLALNATIEAARAGEAGRGFAVVATEVKNLARQTSHSTEQITARIAAIAAAAQLGQTAIDGIVGAVSELDMIVTQVAVSVEEQSAATGEIAASVQAASVAAGCTAGQVSSMADIAIRCVGSVQATKAISEQAVEQIGGLQQALVKILRTRVADLNRRAARRIRVDTPARLMHAGASVNGKLRDISFGGALFEGHLPDATGARLQVDGLPEVEVRIAGRGNGTLHLAFILKSDEMRQQMEDAVTRLVGGAEKLLAA